MTTYDKLKHLLQKLPHKQQVKFALYCANDVRHLMKDELSTKALDTVALWLEGKATDREVEEAAYKAARVGHDASYYAASAATHAAYSVEHAADTTATTAAAHAASSSLKPETKLLEYYKTLLNSFTNFEKELYNIDIN